MVATNDDLLKELQQIKKLLSGLFPQEKDAKNLAKKPDNFLDAP